MYSCAYSSGGDELLLHPVGIACILCLSCPEVSLSRTVDTHILTVQKVQARITKSDISAEAAEAGVRAVASMSVTKACEVLHTHVLSKGMQPCINTTLPLLFRELKVSENPSAFEELVAAVEPGLLQASGVTNQDVEAGGQSGSMQAQHDAMKCLNMMLRQFAKLDVDGAVARVRSYHKQGIIIEGATYSQLAAASLTAGDFPQAEMMLEMRDYL